MAKRFGPFIAIALLVGGCIPAPDPKVRQPSKQAKMALPANADIKACMQSLDKMGASYTLLPDQYSGNCSAINAVKLTAVGIPITNLTATQCPLAKAFAAWSRTTVQQAARQVYGARVVRLETMGSYSCRSVKGKSTNRLSEHAFANAIDVSGFVFSNGHRVTLSAGWNGDVNDARFLRLVRDAACKQFQTVLSPDYNAAHHDHLHFDMGRGPYCR